MLGQSGYGTREMAQALMPQAFKKAVKKSGGYTPSYILSLPRHYFLSSSSSVFFFVVVFFFRNHSSHSLD